MLNKYLESIKMLNPWRKCTQLYLETVILSESSGLLSGWDVTTIQ